MPVGTLYVDQGPGMRRHQVGVCGLMHIKLGALKMKRAVPLVKLLTSQFGFHS